MNAYPYAQPQSYQATQFFPQPQGNVYLINNSLEAANVPMGAEISIALCPSEGLMYLKTLQGGAPSLLVYSFAPYEPKEEPQQPQPDYGAEIAELRAQVESLLKKSKGGSFNELI